MKIIQKIMLITMLLIVCVNVSAKELDDYKFPIVPGTEEWVKLKTNTKRSEALQIPDKILKNMTTEGLIETCANYPDYIFFLLYNNYQKGIEITISKFNGLRELLKRKDRGEKLLEYYINFSNKKYNDRAMYALKLSYLELVICQDSVLINLNNNNLVCLAKTCISKIKNLKYLKMYDGCNIATSACFLARIMQTSKYAPYLEESSLEKDKRLFLNLEKYSLASSEKTVNAVIDLAKKFIDDSKKGE